MSSSNSHSASKYNGIDTVRTATLEDGDQPLILNHCDNETSSLLVYSTSKGNICGLDLRSMKLAWKYETPAYLGSLTAFTIDTQNSWLLSGTHRGVFALWDLRFRLRVKTWAHPSRTPVQRLVRSPLTNRKSALNPAASTQLSASNSFSGKTVFAAVGGSTSEIGLWDIEAGECQEVWCAFGGLTASSGKSSASRATKNVEGGFRSSESVVTPAIQGSSSGGSSMSEDMNRIYGKGLKAVVPPNATEFLAPINPKITSDFTTANVKAIFAPSESLYMLAAGTDRKIRFWDFSTFENSYVVSGAEAGAKLRYSSHVYKDVSFNIEYTPPLQQNSLSGRIAPLNGALPNQNGSSEVSTTIASPNIINHLDGINDMTVTQVPYPMIISCGRDGVIKLCADYRGYISFKRIIMYTAARSKATHMRKALPRQLTNSNRGLWNVVPRPTRRPAAFSPLGDPFLEPFAAMERRMNSIFNELASPVFSNSPAWTAFASGSPTVDVSESEKAYFVTADLPGIKKEEITVTVKNNVLTISGERKVDTEEKNDVRHVVERSYGSFSRSIALPNDVSNDKISASMENGVLKLEIPKNPLEEGEGVKKIDIA
ncbi:Serine/threonine-protein kinase [Physocladia obscura]|uniref:Serine/threonine-protein kinase n=1 Tax=Physocladia obscura TaxID=109957 RepID=A0AAD5SYE2_9FUNG|nr:Serine/threonine-protein kinase [Physocladia obscura]